MLRVIAFLLLLANILFFAFDHQLQDEGSNPDRQRLQQQINPERIQIIARGDPAPICLAWNGLRKPVTEELEANLVAIISNDTAVEHKALARANGAWSVNIRGSEPDLRALVALIVSMQDNLPAAGACQQ